MNDTQRLTNRDIFHKMLDMILDAEEAGLENWVREQDGSWTYFWMKCGSRVHADPPKELIEQIHNEI